MVSEPVAQVADEGAKKRDTRDDQEQATEPDRLVARVAGWKGRRRVRGRRVEGRLRGGPFTRRRTCERRERRAIQAV